MAENRTTEESWVVAPQLLRFIQTRDRRVNKAGGWQRSAISDSFSELLERGRVVVGGRASCGGRVDPTWVELSAWNEVVRKARSLGFDIRETSIKQKNAWATRGGGFWHEYEYTLAPTPPDPDHEQETR